MGGALRGALSGAGRGALLGGAVGALGGAAAGPRAQQLSRALSGRKDIAGSLSRFGERQVHSLTGALPEGMTHAEGLRSIGASTADRFNKAVTDHVQQGVTQQAAHAEKLKKLQDMAEKATPHAQAAEDMGLTSVPGFFKAMATRPVEAITTSVKHQWHGSGNMGRALTFGIPAAQVGHAALATPTDGESRKKKVTRAVVGSLPFLAAPSMGLAGSMALSAGANALMKKRTPLPQQPPPDDYASANVPREFSDRATGAIGGGLV